MNILTRIILIFLSVIFPKLRKTLKEDSEQYTYRKIPGNSECYCKSGLKYKHCHLKINEKKGKVALIKTDKNKSQKIVLHDKGKAESLLKRNYRSKIEVQNTYDEIHVFLGSSRIFPGVPEMYDNNSSTFLGD